MEGRTDHGPTVAQASRWEPIIPGCLALPWWSPGSRARHRLDPFHLRHELEATQVLRMPFVRVGDQAAPISLALTIDTYFRPAARVPVWLTMVYWGALVGLLIRLRRADLGVPTRSWLGASNRRPGATRRLVATEA